jgi:hypothetical protein
MVRCPNSRQQPERLGRLVPGGEVRSASRPTEGRNARNAVGYAGKCRECIFLLCDHPPGVPVPSSAATLDVGRWNPKVPGAGLLKALGEIQAEMVPPCPPIRSSCEEENAQLQQDGESFAKQPRHGRGESKCHASIPDQEPPSRPNGFATKRPGGMTGWHMIAGRAGRCRVSKPNRWTSKSSMRRGTR